MANRTIIGASTSRSLHCPISKYRVLTTESRGEATMFQQILANIELEAMVVGVVCAVFLVLFVVSGVRQIMKDRE